MSTPGSADLPATYRAWTWQGSAEPRDLLLETRVLERPEAGDVLVRNVAIGLNPVDWKVLSGDLAGWAPGHIPGVDGAGVVTAVGDGVSANWIGKRVAYHQSLTRHGSFAEFVPIKPDALLHVPVSIDLATAAGVPCPALTAWLALDKIPTRAGERLLVSGAGGAVGRYLVQFAVRRGWRVAVLCNPRHFERLADLGAEVFLPGALSEGQPWPDNYPGGYTAVTDSVNGDHAMRIAPALKANGHLVCIQGRVAGWPDEPFDRTVSLHEVALGALHLHGDAADWRRLTEAGDAMLQDIGDGVLVPEPIVVRAFQDLPAHLDALRHRAFSGKPVIRI
jgi:NADPH:quinone reductase-like Zn-dependent oxidoreductase